MDSPRKYRGKISYYEAKIFYFINKYILKNKIYLLEDDIHDLIEIEKVININFNKGFATVLFKDKTIREEVDIKELYLYKQFLELRSFIYKNQIKCQFRRIPYIS